jgi:hypothetical protein
LPAAPLESDPIAWARVQRNSTRERSSPSSIFAAFD